MAIICSWPEDQIQRPKEVCFRRDYSDSLFAQMSLFILYIPLFHSLLGISTIYGYLQKNVLYFSLDFSQTPSSWRILVALFYYSVQSSISTWLSMFTLSTAALEDFDSITEVPFLFVRMQSFHLTSLMYLHLSTSVALLWLFTAQSIMFAVGMMQRYVSALVIAWNCSVLTIGIPNFV
jgi:hypothetical protein